MRLSGILGHVLDVTGADVLYDRPFTPESLAADFVVGAGDWRVEDGWLVGRRFAEAGGFAFTRSLFPGDLLVRFTAALVPPCDHDLNFCFRSEGWDAAADDAGRAYIGGLSAWYAGKSGIERYPGDGVQGMTSLLRIEPGVPVRVETGIVGDRLFLFVDGRLVLDLRDPDPLRDPGCGRVGLGVYFSEARFRDLAILRPRVLREDARYTGPDRVERTEREEDGHG